MPGRSSRSVRGAHPNLICSQLRVRDLQRAEEFYRVLGLRRVTTWTMEDGEELLWLRDPRTKQLLELYYVPRRSRFSEPFRHARRYETALLFGVKDSRTLIPELRRRGGKVRADFEERGVRIVFITDLDGNLVELVSWSNGSRRGSAEVPLLDLVLPTNPHLT